jgi:hypothetical protein
MKELILKRLNKQGVTLAELLALPYDQVVSGGPTVQGNYNITWNEAYNNPIANCKLITVKVTYHERGVQRRPIQLTCVKP